MNIPKSNMTRLQTDIVQILANRTDADDNLDPIILYDWVPENNPPNLYVIIDGYPNVDERTHADKSSYFPGDGTHYLITLRAVARAPHRGFSAANDLLEEIECTIAKDSKANVRGFTQETVSNKVGEPISGPNDPIRSVVATFDFYLS